MQQITATPGNHSGFFPFSGQTPFVNGMKPDDFHGTWVFNLPEGVLFCEKRDDDLYWSMSFWDDSAGPCELSVMDDLEQKAVKKPENAFEKTPAPEIPEVRGIQIDFLTLFGGDSPFSSGMKTISVAQGRKGSDIVFGEETLSIRDGVILENRSVWLPRYVFENFRIDIREDGSQSLSWDFRPNTAIFRFSNCRKISLGDAVIEVVDGKLNVTGGREHRIAAAFDGEDILVSVGRIVEGMPVLSENEAGRSSFRIEGESFVDVTESAPALSGEFPISFSVEPEFRIGNRRGAKKDGVISFVLDNGILLISRKEGKTYQWRIVPVDDEKPVEPVAVDLAYFNGKIERLELGGGTSHDLLPKAGLVQMHG